MMTASTARLLSVAALLMTAVYLFPLYWMYVTSLKTESGIFASPPALWPVDPQWANYPEIWRLSNVGLYLWNSTIIAFGVTALVVLFGTGAAYVLARYRTIWIDAALFFVLMMQVLPPSLMITPIYVGFAWLGLLDTPQTAAILAIAGRSLPFYIILARAAFLTVPRELEEAALVDGNSRAGAFAMIVMPLARNGLLVTALIIFMQSFGEYVYSTSIIADSRLQPASIGMTRFLQPNIVTWNGIMAFAAMFVTPIIVAFVLLQRQIVSGLTSGALK
ncbi:carbohydrate ABC transporter permease [Rubrimonas sp.]|uniref:carbohydrate ABC transporter permease n=1 Tax=Rubrimonas sp. TaxID=2036015 RepID=UPI002FDDB4EE